MFGSSFTAKVKYGNSYFIYRMVLIDRNIMLIKNSVQVSVYTVGHFRLGVHKRRSQLWRWHVSSHMEDYLGLIVDVTGL